MDRNRVLAVLKGGVRCKTHKGAGLVGAKKYTHSFVAKDAVAFLVSSGTARSESEAIGVGKIFQKEGLIERLTGKGTFDNDASLFRFCRKLTGPEGEDIMKKMAGKIEIKNRKIRLSTYKDVFVGSEFVNAMIGALCVDRNEATQIGNALLKKDYIEHVPGGRDFEDENLLYRFYKPKMPSKAEEDSNSKKSKTFNSIFDRGGKLGEGAFSVVIEAKEKDSGESYAIKIVTKSKLSLEDEVALKDEIQVLRELKHENIIRLYGVFDEPDYIYLVTERMMGGELFDRIVQKAYYNEKEARDVCKILLDALAYCHDRRVAHRDLKPENLLLVSKEDDNQLKLADFGFAKTCTEPKSLRTQCGTPGYVAPEILFGVQYDTQADIWSLGVIIYILLGGYPPFIDKTQKNLFRKIKRGEYEFHAQYWSSVSPGAKKLITRMLTVDPDERITAQEALKDDWILGNSEELAGMDLSVNLTEFKKFNAMRKFKGAVKAVMMINKMESLGLDLLDNTEEED